jgi:CheY-like chemotaxis protein
MEQVIKLVEALVWPAVVLFVAWRFHDAVAALVKPAEAGQTTVKVGPTGVEITRIASSAAAAAIAATTQRGGEPAAASDGTAQQQIVRNIAGAVAAGLEASATGTKALRLLWVDDEPANNRLLVGAFRELGIEVAERTSTEAGLQALREGRYDLLITDMGRPPDDEAGMTLLRAVRAEHPSLPVVIHAARWAMAHRGQERTFGADLITNNVDEVYAFVLRAARRGG